MKINWERITFGLPTLLFSFALIILDAANIIDIEKFGYAVIGGWVAILINFYYRKNKKEEK
ncbi:hypothetical protein LCGC14_1303440 [marine sediment metagenome]|uniref:Uncharacterized protein n=1 Tax=marine sediment metagenome TaxID=412755 RepID=A0A0F9KPB6_9ZZZZ